MVDRDVAASATAVRIARTPSPRFRTLRAHEAAFETSNKKADASAFNHVRILLSPLHVLVDYTW